MSFKLKNFKLLVGVIVSLCVCVPFAVCAMSAENENVAVETKLNDENKQINEDELNKCKEIVEAVYCCSDLKNYLNEFKPTFGWSKELGLALYANYLVMKSLMKQNVIEMLVSTIASDLSVETFNDVKQKYLIFLERLNNICDKVKENENLKSFFITTLTKIINWFENKKANLIENFKNLINTNPNDNKNMLGIVAVIQTLLQMSEEESNDLENYWNGLNGDVNKKAMAIYIAIAVVTFVVKKVAEQKEFNLTELVNVKELKGLADLNSEFKGWITNIFNQTEKLIKTNLDAANNEVQKLIAKF